MDDDGLNAARGIVYGVILGTILWATILLIVWAAFVYEPSAGATGRPAACTYDFYAVRNGEQEVC